MKKRAMALLLAGVMVLSNGALVLAEEAAPVEQQNTVVTDSEVKDAEPEVAPEEAVTEEVEATPTVEEAGDQDKAAEEKKYNYVSAADAMAKAGETDVILVDTRLAEDYAAGHLKGALSVPSRTSKDNTAEVETDALKAFANAVLKGNDKKVYIICYSGNRFAQVATDVFAEVLGSDSRLFTVEGGMKAMAEATLKTDAYITIENALANKEAGKGMILDVRTKGNFNRGHIEGSKWITVTDAKGNDDAAAKAKFVEAVQKLGTKELYVLCNTGSSLAERAQLWLKDSGITVYTIVGGHDKNLEAVKWVGWNYVSAADAVAKAGKTDVLLVDTRQPKDYEAGHLKGALSAPSYIGDVNDKNLQAAALQEFAKTYLADNNKPVYIICYSGNRYAQAATAEFVKVLGNDDRLFTVEGGMGAIKEAGYEKLARTDKYITLDVARANSAAKKGVILDVRAEEFYKAGHLEDSVWVTVTNAKGTDDAAAKEAFLKEVAKLDAKELYVLCNTGSSLAERAQVWLKDSGITVYTIVGGRNLNANAPWVISYNFISADKAVEKAGKTDVILLDVRQPDAYAAGHIKGAVNVPAYIGDVKDENIQTEALKAFAEVNLKGTNKDVYVICYSGNRYAQAATKVFTDVCGTNKHVYTVEGGMKKVEDVEGYTAAKRTDAYITMADALANKDNAIILDVRAKEFYDAGHIKDCKWITAAKPEDEKAFKEAAAKLDPSKPIYIICNTGSSLAERAQGWLREMKVANPLYTVTGGHNLNPDAPWVKTEANKVPPTGDSAALSGLFAVAAVAAGAAVVADKKRREF